MKTKTILLSLLLLVLAGANSCCKNRNHHLLRIDLQSDFIGNNVQIYIDNQKVYNKIANTNYTVSFADYYSDTIKEDYHIIKIIIDHQYTHQFNVNLDKNLYIGINYNNVTHTINKRIQDEPFFYD
jgi:hypothetical protein